MLAKPSPTLSPALALDGTTVIIDAKHRKCARTEEFTPGNRRASLSLR
jgi:hypothetical protein